MLMQDDSEEQASLDEGRKAAFRLSLLSKRREAIAGREGSGIEMEWIEDEEHYQGIDDANRAYVTSIANSGKRWATTGRSTSDGAPKRSVIFLNMTRPYVDAASARVADMLLPTDDRAWALKPTPIPKMPPALVSDLGGPEAAHEALESAVERATKAAEEMQSEIDDCLTEANWHGEVRHLIEDSARLGSGVLKGPYPCKRAVKMYRDNNGIPTYISVTEIKPGTKRIDPWNFFPDPACGESIHNGSYTWEREYVTAKQIRDMMDMPGYDRSELINALRDGPAINQARMAADGNVQRNSEQYEMWIFYGDCDVEDLMTAGLEVEPEAVKVPAMAVLINDRMVKVAMNVMDTGDFPYDVLAWQRRPGMPWGTGVARQMRTVQRMLNGACRAMMDNSGQTASPQIVIGNGVTPADGQWEIRGGKIWRADSDTQDVTRAFYAFVPPSVQAELMNIIQFAMKMAEDTTGMPAMLQGIRGDAPNTLGGMQMQNNNATSVLRRLAKRFDDYVTRPHIRRYFDWMMQHSDRDEIKGDFQIDVRASSALVERDAQQQFLLQMAQLARDPQFGIDPAKLFAELAKGQRLDPKRFQFPQEQIEAMRNRSNPVDEAKAGLLAAQIEKTKAEAATKNVEGMFSATQAAANVAVQPGIAGAADAMWRSAGGEDKDAAPAIPAVNAPAMPPESNSNPLTPANPATGMNTGIEGGT